MKDFWIKWKNSLPSLVIGILFTFTLAFLTTAYYAADFDAREDHGNIFVSFFHRMHQASVDWRLRFRGPRAGSDDIVILAVDEKSLLQEGQWPWPRRKFSEVISRIVGGGARAIGFDVVWAEKEASDALSLLKADLKNNPAAQSVIDNHIRQSRSDQILGQSVEKYADKVVLGAYFEPPVIGGFTVPKGGYKNLCLEEVYRKTKNASYWENVEPKYLVNDQTLREVNEEVPEPWLDVLDAQLAELKSKTRQEFLAARVARGAPEKLGRTAEIELEIKEKEAAWNYCRRWLNPPSHPKPDESWEGYKEIWPEVQEESERFAKMSFEEGVATFKKEIYNTQTTMVGDWIFNIPSIGQNAKNVGYFNAKQDSDGTIRRSFLMVRSGTSYFPSMSFVTYLVATGQLARLNLKEEPASLGRFKAIEELELTDVEGKTLGAIPTDKVGYLTINYAGPAKMFHHLSLADVLNDAPTVTTQRLRYSKKLGGWEQVDFVHNKKDFYKNKIFVVGATATGIYDLRVTPFQQDFPGVETHANVVDNLLRGDFLKSHPQEEKYMLLFILLFGTFFTVVITKFGALVGFLSSSGTLLGLFLLDKYYFFEGNGTVVTIVFPFTLLIGIYAALTIYKYFTEEKNKKQLKGTFGKYVSPAIVEEILAHPENIELGGRKQKVTVFFSDVRGFTTISEMLSAEALSDLLNEYLSPMTDIIFENGGTLDKYIGDAIMAFFGAPIYHSSHADDGCRTALQNIEKLFELQKGFRERKLPDIDVGIGLNTGEVNVGNMGSNTVRNYTIMGDSVNLGARLEGITKQYGVRIIISEFTKKEISDSFFTREVDCVKVKGKNEPVHIFELMGENELPDDQAKVLEAFNSGYRFYHETKWDKAIASFNKALSHDETDGPSKLYLGRCEDYKKSPPPEDWDGVFTMTTK